MSSHRSNNIVDLSNLEDGDLINELEKRGYKTQLLFDLSDVDIQLKKINDEREDEIVLTELDKRNVLDLVFQNIEKETDSINDSIEETIIDEYDN